jgi:hypothetical protein
MKPNAVAAPVLDSLPSRRAILAPLAVSVFLFFSTGSAFALDGIDLSTPAEAVAEGECPRLIQIKYPFLSCAEGQIGMAEGDDTWEESRRIPLGEAWTEGFGYWGPTLNDPNSDEF